ncbi:uncharacterized protein LOC127244952 isoform X4 [Andrographis paniculata]|uniref:uncharacterized protein LOC127244952 isoform X4 n=1 Tax=Andrographis paniculata TaxID=175694 RepID=UPI0021E7FC41|nr:uncharacterized protein LOC127244952 isoform X4 [Andrographis paniculata]
MTPVLQSNGPWRNSISSRKALPSRFASEPQIMQYIKIAALLNDKTVRDVALRCQWMARKRRKQDDQSIRKKFKEQKDKLKEMSLKNNITAPSSVSVPSYLSATKLHNLSDCMHSGVLSHMFRHLLEENNQAFLQISANLSTLKLQDNIELFSRTKNNLTTILNDMRNMPGVMGQMPPLPVLLNEELASSIFPNSSQRSRSDTSKARAGMLIDVVISQVSVM